MQPSSVGEWILFAFFAILVLAVLFWVASKDSEKQSLEIELQKQGYWKCRTCRQMSRPGKNCSHCDSPRPW